MTTSNFPGPLSVKFSSRDYCAITLKIDRLFNGDGSSDDLYAMSVWDGLEELIAYDRFEPAPQAMQTSEIDPLTYSSCNSPFSPSSDHS